MKAIDYARIFGTMVLCQFAAPLMILDLPSIRKITVRSVTVRPAMTSNSVEHVSPDGRTTVYNVLPESPGYKTVLSIEDIYARSRVLIDHDNALIHSMTPSWYASDSNKGSGDLGVAIMGLPGIIIASPILIINSIVWYFTKLVTGMDRHALSFYLRVSNQLDDESRALLKKALRKL